MTRRETHIVITLLILALLLGSVLACFAFDAPRIEFGRVRYDDLTMEYGAAVPSQPVTAVYRSDVFHRGGIPLAVAITSPRSPDLGTYAVRYRAERGRLVSEGSYLLHVVDTMPPVLTVDADTLAYAASDTHDGDLTAAVRVDERDDRWEFTVADRSGNTAVQTVKKPEPDVTPPVFAFGDGLLDFTCTDERDGDLTAQVRCWESDGYLYYEAADRSGNTASERRRIAGGQKVVYLTFDDGPSEHTERLLDVLKEYGVKATFFVVGKSRHLDLLPRMRAEGHSIGAHTYSHDYGKVYASVDAYFDDLALVQERIREQLGEETKLIRFPGGSSNTISRQYQKGLMSQLTRLVTEQGYVYFDWNVFGNDAGGTTDARQVAANVKAGVAARPVSVVLQHDTKGFSVDAVEEILRWGQENGYVFLPLTERSTPAHHGLNN